jgi:hypothetical protein
MTKAHFFGALFFLFVGGQLSAQSQGLQLVVKGADQYPTTLAYDILDADGNRIVAGFAPLNDANTPVWVPVDLPQTFGVVIYEDANGNEELDMGIFGQPTELYGFSNGAWKFLGRPEHEELLLQKKSAVMRLELQLKSVMDY